MAMKKTTTQKAPALKSAKNADQVASSAKASKASKKPVKTPVRTTTSKAASPSAKRSAKPKAADEAEKPLSQATPFDPATTATATAASNSNSEEVAIPLIKSPSLVRAKPVTAKRADPKKQKPEVRHVEAEIVDGDQEANDAEDSVEPVEVDEDADSAVDADSDDVISRLPVKITSRALTSKDPIATYLSEVRKYPVLTREQETEIAKRYYETKDPAAAQALVTANLRFVVKVAAEYSKFGARLIDLVQEGNMGLMHAVRDFNPYKNVRLITYAVWWIRGYIQEYLMKQYSLVKIGTTQNQKKLFYRLQKEKDALDAMGVNPTAAMISTKLGIPQQEVQEMAQRLRGRDMSLSQTFDDDTKSSMMDFQKSDEAKPDELMAREEELKILREKLEILRPQLSEREMILLEERLLADEPLTLQEIGEKYGITREAVRQMEVRLLEKIRRSLQSLI